MTFSGAGATTEGDDADVRVQRVSHGDAVLDGTGLQPERRQVLAEHGEGSDVTDRSQRTAAAPGGENDPGVQRQILRAVRQVDAPLLVPLIHLEGADFEYFHTAVAVLGRLVVVVILRGQTQDAAGQQTHRQVPRDHRHLADRDAGIGVLFVGQLVGDGEDADVVVAVAAQRIRQSALGHVVEFDAHSATGHPDRDPLFQASTEFRRGHP